MKTELPAWSQDFLDRLPPSLAHVALLVGAALVAWCVAWLTAYLTQRTLKRWLGADRSLGAILDSLRAPMYRILPLAAMAALEPLAPQQRGIGLLHRLVLILLVASVTWAAVRLVNAFAAWVNRRHPIDVADNLAARRIATQTRVLARVVNGVLILVGAATALTTVPGARQIGTSLLASAGLAGLVVGLAARPVFANLIAGLQLALTQPVRLDDVVVVEKEWGRIEEIGSSFIVVRLWDERRLVVPLNYFLEHPFENWTRTGASLLATVFLWVDFGVPLDDLRAELKRLCEASPRWDRRVCLLQVTDADDRAMQLRVLVSAADSSLAFDLRCELREALLDWLRREHPERLPRSRQIGYAPDRPLRAGDAAA